MAESKVVGKDHKVMPTDYKPSAWRVGTKVFATLFEALVYSSRFTHHKVIPLYE